MEIQSDVFAVIQWITEDIKQVLVNNGIPATQENINVFLKSRGARTLEEVSIEYGWDILNNLVCNMKTENAFNR